jgi:RND superfamily putative drug exporter
MRVCKVSAVQTTIEIGRIIKAKSAQILVLISWAIVSLVSLPFAAKVNQELDTTTTLVGSESAGVETDLRQRFRSPFAKLALLRMTGAPTPLGTEGRSVLQQASEAVKKVPGVQGVASYVDRDDSLFVLEDGSSLLIVGLDAGKNNTESDDLMRSLKRATDEFQLHLRTTYPQLAFRWTGEALVNADLRRLSAASTRAAELTVFPLTLVVLLVAFRGLAAAALPLLSGAVTILVSLGLLTVLNRVWPVSIIVVSIISMVGLGLSIDYALLIVSRYRELMAAGWRRTDAVYETLEHAGHTVIVSGSAVAIGFAAMLFVPVSDVRSIGLGGLLVTTVAVLVAISLLPTVLIRMDALIDAGRMATHVKAATGQTWRRWATWVSQNPLRVLAFAGAPLLLLAAQALPLRVDLPRGGWLPESADSVRALHEIDAVAKGNFGQTIYLILDLPMGSSIQQESGWRATSQLVRHFARDPRIQHVWAITTVIVKPLAGPEILSQIPESVRDGYITRDGRATVVQLLPKQNLASTDAALMVREIRAEDPRALTGLAGSRLQVGGVPAFNVDYQERIVRSLASIAAVVICATLLVLSVTFRSVLVPLKAVFLNMLSVAASFGAATLVFQSNCGSRLLGLPRPLVGGFPIVPMLVFCIVFGLSMDYEVFLVARIADGRRAGLSDAAALVEGVAGMGRVITFAAAIMIMIFCGFVFGDFILIKILGFTLGIAVLVDATLIRLAIGPALMQLAGRWNWWPGRRYGGAG